MRNWIKILLPIVGFFYCIAFLEINFPGGVHQTWDDQYDTYIPAQSYNDVTVANLSVDIPLGNSAIPGISNVSTVIYQVIFLSFIPVIVLSYNFSVIYLINCKLII
jgi:hypothetical protein